jgi:hypothetical protein
MHIDEYQDQEGGLHMRFLYKRPPAEELHLEIRDVRQVMCSGGLVLFDLLFYSFIFALLIMPVKAGFVQFGALFLFIYSSFSCLFFIVRKTMNKDRMFKNYP